MADYAWKLTRAPHEVEASDIDPLRAVDFDDPAIAAINGVCAYFNMLNRIASGLGVEGTPGVPIR